MMAVASANVAATMIGVKAFGSRWRRRNRGRQRRPSARRGHSPTPAPRAGCRRSRANIGTLTIATARDLQQAAIEERHDPDRQQDTGDRQEDVDDAHDDSVDLAAGATGSAPMVPPMSRTAMTTEPKPTIRLMGAEQHPAVFVTSLGVGAHDGGPRSAARAVAREPERRVRREGRGRQDRRPRRPR